MKIQKFSQIGTRENNEDFLGYNNNAFLVCDGVGGNTAGEFASKFITETVLQNISKPDNDINKISIQQTITNAQIKLNDVLNEKPELAKMGTTFTGVFFADNLCFVAHIGDSRVYLIRPEKKIIWHTWDHSLVGQLVKSNDITREAGRHHPMGNRISRAVIANTDDKTAKADIVKLTQLQKGDILFLCSDGINEAWPEHELMDLLCKQNLSLEEKTETIKSQCNKFSKDNNTAILIEIEEKDAFDFGKNEEISFLPLSEFFKDYQTYLDNENKENQESEEYETPEENHQSNNKSQANQEKPAQTNKNDRTGNDNLDLADIEPPKKRRYLGRIIIILIFIALIAFAVFKIVSNKHQNENTNDDKIENQENPDIKPDDYNSQNSEDSKRPIDRIDNSKKNEDKLTEEDLYNLAIQRSDEKIYQQYLDSFPNGEHIQQIQKLLDKLNEESTDTEEDDIESGDGTDSSGGEDNTDGSIDNSDGEENVVSGTEDNSESKDNDQDNSGGTEDNNQEQNKNENK
jgi:PPM family protein phosphatase